MRVNQDGSITFPQNGLPPKKVDGYDVDPNDPYVFYPVWESCKYRYQRAFLCSNGRIRHRPSCKLLSTDVTYKLCSECTKCES